MAEPSSQPAAPSRRLTRELGLLDATMIVAGSMIGSGIFIVSAKIARELGCSGWLLAAWLLTGVLTVSAALAYAELAGMMPRVGGQYTYLREAYSPLWGFLYGWTLFLVIQTGTIAAVAAAFARFLGVLLPQISESQKLLGWGRFSVTPATLVAIGLLIFLTWLNARGLKTGKTVQNVFTFAKIAALLLLILLGLAIGANWEIFEANFHKPWQAIPAPSAGAGVPTVLPKALSGLALLLALGSAMVGSLFSSDAWNNVTFTGGEVKRPERNLPLSLVLGVSLVTVLYLLSNLAYLSVLPLRGSAAGTTALERGIQFATDDRVATAMAEVIFGSSAARIMAVLIMISTFGCVNGMILAGARVYYAMAQDGLFFARVGELNQHGVPRNGLMVQCAWACLLAASGTYSDLLDYVIFAVLLFYVLTIAGVFVLRRKRPDVERPYRAFGYPVLPALYVGVASGIALALLISPITRANTWPGLILVLAGAPVYWFWRRRRG